MPKNNSASNQLKIDAFDVVAYMKQGIDGFDSDTMEEHTHDRYEIYINATGAISFVVEDRLYHINEGDVVIVRPDEKHRYICDEITSHNYYCFHFTSDENNEILTAFLDSLSDSTKLITLPNIYKKKMLNMCKTLIECKDSLKNAVTFYSLLDLIRSKKAEVNPYILPKDVQAGIEFIKQNYQRSISVKDVANHAHTTVNTLGRHFKASVGMSPYEYIQNCRFTLAVYILEIGGSISCAALESGFSDYSHFISMFKKKYGKTPAQFKKEL